jgi:SAM-dependent methyltransferase
VPDETTTEQFPSLMGGDESAALDNWALQARARATGPDYWACEVGCYHGFSTAIIARYFRVWAIDLGGDIFHCTEHPDTIGTETSDAFRINMVGRGLIPDRVVPVCSTSDCLSILPVAVFDFALVDADHSYEWCGRDMRNVARVLNPGGIMAVHDYIPERGEWPDNGYGVTDAVNHFLRDNPEWQRIDFVGSLMFISRVDYGL